MLSDISNYDLENDFVKQRKETVKNLSVADIKKLAETYVNPDKMYYLIIGDAKTQLNKLEKLGLGKPVLLNEK